MLMKRLVYVCLLFFLIPLLQAQETVSSDTILMGSRFKITIVEQNRETAHQKINQIITEIVRIEDLISDWRAWSQVSEVNKNAGIKAVKVDREVLELTQRAIHFSKLSQGAFDISFAAMDRIWRFDDSMEQLPTAEEIRQAIQHIDYRNIILDERHSTIFLKNKGMKIGFGATGKGYAAYKASEYAKSLGILAGIIDASGDIQTWGKQPNGAPWSIGITNPKKRGKFLDILYFTNAAVATSGDYEKFLMIDGKRYSHIINPKTGMPSTGLTSVTVIGPNAEMCNGFSTSLMVLGKKDGLKLINQHPDYAAMMMTDSGKIIKSKHYRRVKRNLK